ncbi:nitroreductase [Staphylococcus rostri]|uniref:nitroreductase n=1 Tax=Staphylococcus rostri TaxID=522262 RepID=UPI00285261D6|nr:nitroreductase [Staphylococcus rostri]
MSESILRQRHSVRSFLDKPIDNETIQSIIADAHLTPSWCNTQPWKVYIATGNLAKKLCKTHYDNTLHTQSWCEIPPPQDNDWNTTTAVNRQGWFHTIASLDNKNKTALFDMNSNNFNAPVIIYITAPAKATAYSYYDIGAFGYGITLSAYEHNIGSIPAYEFIRYPHEIRAVFDIPEDEKILLGIGLGYPDDHPINSIHRTTGRVPIESMMTIKEN